MDIKRVVALSFSVIILLIMSIAAINSTALYKIIENQDSQKRIYQLVTMQDSMNKLLQRVAQVDSQEQLEEVEAEFVSFEKKFEKIKSLLTVNDKDDILDRLIVDVHNYPQVRQWTKEIYSHEKEIEDIFEDLYLLQEDKLLYMSKFQEEYPKENQLRKSIETFIFQQNNNKSMRTFSDLKYYSKEALFQHRDKTTFNKWIDSTKILANKYNNDILNEYLKTVDTLKNYVLLQELLQTKSNSLQQRALNVLEHNRELHYKIEGEIEDIVSNFLSNTQKVLIATLLFTVIFTILLFYKVRKNVGLSVDEIEAEVQKGLEEISLLNNEIENTQKEVVFTMGAIGESRSKETGNHVKRVAEYSYLLAKLYGLDEHEAEILKQASPMHDIGKVAIPDAILNKPGRFNEEERKIMDTHAKLGFDMLKHSNRELLKTAAIVAYEHHEKYDGTGYPQKTKGEDIHIYGRITALADVFDALGSERVYKKAWSDEKIFNLFKEEKGKHFDPKLIDLFFDNQEKFLEIREKFKDL